MHQGQQLAPCGLHLKLRINLCGWRAVNKLTKCRALRWLIDPNSHRLLDAGARVPGCAALTACSKDGFAGCCVLKQLARQSMQGRAQQEESIGLLDFLNCLRMWHVSQERNPAAGSGDSRPKLVQQVDFRGSQGTNKSKVNRDVGCERLACETVDQQLRAPFCMRTTKSPGIDPLSRSVWLKGCRVRVLVVDSIPDHVDSLPAFRKALC